MSSANGLRLLLVARLSQAKTSGRRDGVSIETQDEDARQWARDEGHAVVATVPDIKSGTVAPWLRRNLKPWMSEPAKLATYDGILVYHLDRLSRADQADWTYIEHWALEHGKRLVVMDGPQYPARSDSEQGDWNAEKRGARKEWLRIQARSKRTRKALEDRGHAVGRAPFGYRIVGETYAKRFEIDPVTGPLAREAFQRIADGRSANSVAEWLTERTGTNWRTKRVIEMIQRRTYLGKRDGHEFEPLVSEAEWESANTAMAARFVPKGGRRIVHGYSSVVFCLCGAPLYRNASGRSLEKYRCSRGIRGIVGEQRCGRPTIDFEAANTAVNASRKTCWQSQLRCHRSMSVDCLKPMAVSLRRHGQTPNRVGTVESTQ